MLGQAQLLVVLERSEKTGHTQVFGASRCLVELIPCFTPPQLSDKLVRNNDSSLTCTCQTSALCPRKGGVRATCGQRAILYFAILTSC